MKVPDLEEQQGRKISIYPYLSIYLPPCCRERHPLLLESNKKVVHFVLGPMTSLKLQFGPMTTYSGGVVRETV